MQLTSVDTRPLYLQVAEVLKRYLDEGGFKAGDPLPAVQSLSRQLGVSRSTLREAMAFLEQEGRLVRRHGVGTFVATPPPSLSVSPIAPLTSVRGEAVVRGLHTEVTGQSVATVTAGADEAESLRVPVGTPLIHTTAVILIEGQRVGYFDALWLPDRIAPEAFATSGATMLEWLLDAPESPLAYRVSEVQAVNADARLAKRLAVPEGKAVLHSRDIYFDANDQPFGLEHSYFASERYHYRIVRRVERAFTAQPANRVRGTDTINHS